MLKIISDGTDAGTKIIFHVDGVDHELTNILSVEWSVGVGDKWLATATLKAIDVPFEGTIDGMDLIKIIKATEFEMQ